MYSFLCTGALLCLHQHLIAYLYTRSHGRTTDSSIFALPSPLLARVLFLLGPSHLHGRLSLDSWVAVHPPRNSPSVSIRRNSIEFCLSDTTEEQAERRVSVSCGKSTAVLVAYMRRPAWLRCVRPRSATTPSSQPFLVRTSVSLFFG